ncbi:transposable element Tcb2 transposase [Trichonephila clavipes]|nr:transposable element Tcb2 transposase [Trichonephila clavipes]
MVNTCRYTCSEFCKASVARSAVLHPFTPNLIARGGRFFKSKKGHKCLIMYYCANFIRVKARNRFLETGSAGRRPGQGRRRATTPNEDLNLVLTARRHRNMNATLLQQRLRSDTCTTVSTQTVRNRLHGVGLYARQPMV